VHQYFQYLSKLVLKASEDILTKADGQTTLSMRDELVNDLGILLGELKDELASSILDQGREIVRAKEGKCVVDRTRGRVH
jgi:hypothetical protein